jgi:hypothetical protein
MTPDEATALARRVGAFLDRCFVDTGLLDEALGYVAARLASAPWGRAEIEAGLEELDRLLGDADAREWLPWVVTFHGPQLHLDVLPRPGAAAIRTAEEWMAQFRRSLCALLAAP